MEFSPLELAGLIEIKPKKLNDQRGHFSETFRQDAFEQAAGPVAFVQENESLSRTAGTIRGIHCQTEPFAQGKLVRCIAGRIFDVAVDLRYGSPSYGRWASVELSADDGNQLWIPPGFGHAFCTLAPDSVVGYKVTAYYSAAHECGIRWDDPEIGIAWPAVADASTLSENDKVQPMLAELADLSFA